MRTPDIEGIANHGGPESCVGIRKDAGEALDRGTYRSAIEPRNNSFGVPMPSHEAEGNIVSSAIASCRGPRAVREPWHVRKLHAREPGDPTLARRLITGRVAQGRLRP